MRRPHVFERSAPRSKREAYQQTADRPATGRQIALQLAPMIERAAGDGLGELAALLDIARIEAERIASAL